MVHYEDVSDGEDGEVQASSSTNKQASMPEDAPSLPPLRLRVLQPHRTSSILKDKTVLILDTETAVTIGRDRTFNPSLRIKEMEVSKTHLTLFTNTDAHCQEGSGWYIVDNASTLGTFLSFRVEDENMKPVRLSEAKQASKPFKLSHLDQISISSPTEPVISFEVHLHPKFPSSCSTCALLSDESNRLRLSTDPTLDSRATSTISKSTGEDDYAMTPQDAKANREKKRKTEMAKLRNRFFGAPEKPAKKANRKERQPEAEPEPDDLEPERIPKKYIDRAKLRRQANPASTRAGGPERCLPSSKSALNTPKEEKMDPFRSESKGAILLSKMGGGDQSKMGTIIEAKSMGIQQAGLGSQSLIVGVESLSETRSGSSMDWREKAKEASWKRYHGV